jgi:hypothetical protein
MFEIWANLSLLIGLAIVGGAVYFLVYAIGRIFFEGILGGTISKIKRKIDQDDQYIY